MREVRLAFSSTLPLPITSSSRLPVEQLLTSPVLLDVSRSLPLSFLADLLNACHVSIIKGNAGEIGALAGLSEVAARGVDSVGNGFREPEVVVKGLAARESTSFLRFPRRPHPPLFL